MRRVAILGAGVSGLSAALDLLDAKRERGVDLDLAVYERSIRAGGCIQTLHDGGYTMELGPDSLLAEKPAARDLLRRLNLERELVRDARGVSRLAYRASRQVAPDSERVSAVLAEVAARAADQRHLQRTGYGTSGIGAVRSRTIVE